MAFHAKAKGSRHERNVAELLRGYGWQAKRTPLSGGIEGWKQDVTSPDCPLFIECKNVENVGKQFIDWYSKVAKECGYKTPVVVWTRNREQIYAFLLFTDLLSFVKLSQGNAGVNNLTIKKPARFKKTDMTEDLPFPKNSSTKKNNT